MIHQYKNNGYNIIMDIASGSVHVVDDIIYDAVAILEPVMGELEKPEQIPEEAKVRTKKILEKTYPGEDAEEALQEVQELIDAEELYTKDTYQNYVTDFKKRETVVKALCLHIAHDCNLGCLYFFGGEPLMNWEVVKQLVEYGRSQEEAHNKRFRFTLTTNGVLLNDEIMEFCNREMSNVVLSLDGRKEINDLMRPTRNGHGSSYDIIVPKFQKFAKSRAGKDYYVRGTFTHNNLDFSEDVKHFADLGFDQMSIEPVVTDPSEPYAIQEEDLPKIMEEYDKLAVVYIKRKKEGRGFNFFHLMIDLNQGPCVAKRLSGCGSGTEYLAVTPWGDFYPCHQFVGQEEFLMGNVDTGITRTDIRDEFKLCNVYAKEKCRDCFARFYCSGGCAANSYNFHGKITDAYDIGCEMQKKRIECAIMIKAALADEE